MIEQLAAQPAAPHLDGLSILSNSHDLAMSKTNALGFRPSRNRFSLFPSSWLLTPRLFAPGFSVSACWASACWASAFWASAFWAQAGIAQTVAPDDYNFNFSNMATEVSVFTTGPLLFGSLSGSGEPQFAGVGDSIRTCYGIDSFQGGRNESTGFSNITYLSWVQGHALSSPGVDIGLSSVLAQSVDSLDGDACFSALFFQGLDTMTGQPVTLRSAMGGAFVPGLILQPGTGGGSMATLVLEVVGSNGLGFQMPSTLGSDKNGFPLLPHVIFEVQGPANGGPQNNQYYIASTAENLGLGAGGEGTGGVTNGNGRMAQSLFGAGSTADLTGAISHNRLTAFSPATGLIGTTTVTLSGADHDHWSGYVLASRTPVTWAINNGRTGGGGPDWSVSGSISTIDLRVLDVRAGGEGDSLFSAESGTAPLGSSLDNPDLAVNAPLFLWSASPATLMLQQPLSWDTSTGAAVQGDADVGQFFTDRAGLQRLPLRFDRLTSAFLGIQGLALGQTFRSALDPSDGGVSQLQLGQGLGVDGESRLPNAFPIVSKPKPNLAGRRLGLTAAGLQFDAITGQLVLTEFASACTIVLQ